MNCFANGKEIDTHKKEHAYYVINKLDFSLFLEGWTVEEELLMMEGLEKYGFGNWADIADHLNTGKSKEDIE